MTVLDKVKVIKGIQDDLQDQLIFTLISQVKARLLSKINSTRVNPMVDLPESLDHIVVELTVVRYNQLDSEGAKRHSREGESFEWSDDVLAECEEVLKPYMEEDLSTEAFKPKIKGSPPRVWEEQTLIFMCLKKKGITPTCVGRTTI